MHRTRAARRAGFAMLNQDPPRRRRISRSSGWLVVPVVLSAYGIEKAFNAWTGRVLPGVAPGSDLARLLERLLPDEVPPELVAYLACTYFAVFMLLQFLRALEECFNMIGRIRAERLELDARRAEAKADAREAELREERAARELAGLRET